MPRVWHLKDPGLPHDAVRIDRRTKWGNPFVIGKDGDRDEVIAKYRRWILGGRLCDEAGEELSGKDLACWCVPLPCHGDVLLEIAQGLAVVDETQPQRDNLALNEPESS